jgi:peptidoglycan/LPS O-acetylase OafA/YrhL
LQYRADIEGCRSLAIVPVVLFHAGVPLFSGGFVGVDIFFVISGYLITSLIAEQLSSKTFELSAFYWRRAKRILPALLAMMTFCAVVGSLILAPRDFKNLGESLVATSVFLSNVLFWWQVGYFDPSSLEKPLLHTWSLAVEEQFYITYPVYLLFAFRFSRVIRIGTTAALALASMCLSVWATDHHPNAAFFLSPFRAWELLLGALLTTTIVPVNRQLFKNAVAFGGLGLVLFAIFNFSRETKFPGIAALVPTLGTCLILWSGSAGDTFVGKLLGSPLLTFVGRISYSWYLWHFCIIAFASYLSVTGLGMVETAATIVGSFIVAIFSWKFIEEPIRRLKPVEILQFKAFAGISFLTLSFISFGALIVYTNGIPGRFSLSRLQISAGASDFNQDRDECADARRILKGQFCKMGDFVGSEPQFALWGDSEAEAIRAGVSEAAETRRQGGVFVGAYGCAPLIDIERPDVVECRAVNDEILKWISSTPTVRTVILAGRWAIWAEGVRYKRESRFPDLIPIVSPTHRGVTIRNNADAFLEGLELTVRALSNAGRNVWLVGPIPEVGFDVPRSLFINTLGVTSTFDIRPTYEEFRERQNRVLAAFANVSEKFHVKIVWPDRALCDEVRCDVERDGRPLYSDDIHLSIFGAKQLVKTFLPIFE